MLHFRAFLAVFLFSGLLSRAQKPVVQDTIYLMNGHAVGEKVIDTLLGAVSIYHPRKQPRKLHYEPDQLYMVRYASGFKRYYYVQDSTIGNWFTRDEMWLYMKGENDARRGFKAPGSLIGAGIAGFLGGMTGTLWGPALPYGYMALSGITRIRIRHNTISHPAFIESDAYILGYERVGRQRRKIKSLLGGTVGLVIGYGFYALFHNSYPESINIGIKK